jgi:DNA-binding transcriptional LysR family regulator
MTLDQLAYFLEAARRESVGRAARAVGVSPSAVSTSVRALEEELGCSLFAREKQRVYLTAEGRALMPRAAAILASVAGLRAELAGPERAYEGRYGIACVRVLAAEVVGIPWAELQAAHPRLSVELHTLRSVEIVAKAAAGEIDLGVCLDPAPHPEVVARPLCTTRYTIAVRRGHPLLRVARSALPRALEAYPACMPRSFAGAGAYEAHPGLARLGVRPRVDFAYDAYDVVFPRLRRSDAWALYPPALSEQERRDIAFVSLPDGEIPLVVVAVWPRRRPLNAALSELALAIEKRLARTAREARVDRPAAARPHSDRSPKDPGARDTSRTSPSARDGGTSRRRRSP